MSITRAQQDMLLAPLAESRIESRQGMSYVNVSDVRRYLIRIFGFGGFSTYADEAECISVREGQGSSGKNWEVVWKVRVRLYIDALGVEYTEYAIGSSSQPSLPEAHDMAIKTAESDALKRCAVNLGDQFGLSLYFSKGREPVTQSVMRVYAEPKVDHTLEPVPAPEPVAEDVQALPEKGLTVRPQIEESLDAAADDAGLTVDVTTGEVIDGDTADAIEALADAGVIGIPEDFFDRLTTIREYKTPATRLKHATEFKQELMRLGVRDDQQVTTPNGQTITVAKAFDVAMAGTR
jgi:hypothetical protein